MKVIAFDQVDKFLSNLWEAFPKIIKNPKTDLYKLLFGPVHDWSKEFCDSVDTSVPLIGKGGFNEVIPLIVSDQEITATGISFNWNGYWLPYWTDVVLKKNIYYEKPSMIITQDDDGTFRIKSSAYIHNAIVHSVIGHLSNIEAGLCLPKHFGVFTCSKNRFFEVVEKEDITLDQALIQKKIKPSHLPIIILHLAVQFWAMQKYMGINNFDLFAPNIMLQYFKKDELNRTIIHGEVADDINFFEYILPWGEKITVPNIGYMPKIIDWGVSRIDLRKSHNQPFIFEGNDDVIGSLAQLKKAYKSKRNGDVDYNYLLATIMVVIEHNNLGSYYNKVFNPLYYETVPEKIYDYFGQDMGTTADITSPLQKLLYYMSRLNFRRPKSEYDNGILTVDFTKKKYGRELMQTFIKTSDKRITECVLNKGTRNKCNDYKQELIEWNPNATLPTNFSKNSITSGTPYVWSKKNISLKKTISKDELTPFIQYNNGSSTSMLINFQPSQYPKLVLPNNEKLFFLKTHRLTDFEAPPYYLIDTPLPDINLRLTYLPKQANIECRFGDSLWTALEDVENGVCINGSFFIVDDNIENPITSYLKEDNLWNPIGYYYDRKTNVGSTIYPLTSPYSEDFGVITVSNNKLKLYQKHEFDRLHETINTPILVYCANKNQKTANKKLACFDVPVIAFRNGRPSTKLNYDIAFESGPVLIWDGKIIFTREKMLNSIFDMKHLISKFPIGTPNFIPKGYTVVDDPSKYPYYKLCTEEEDCYAYMNQPGESKFYADQRHSNSFQVIHVLCETWSGEFVSILIEGRGYTTVGLDKAQVASIVSLFNVKNAIGLDGGFSANVLHSIHGQKTFVLHDPEKRAIGISLLWSW